MKVSVKGSVKGSIQRLKYICDTFTHEDCLMRWIVLSCLYQTTSGFNFAVTFT